jgi:hypothetical protein
MWPLTGHLLPAKGQGFQEVHQYQVMVFQLHNHHLAHLSDLYVCDVFKFLMHFLSPSFISVYTAAPFYLRMLCAYLMTISRQQLLDYCPLRGTAAYTAMSNGWTYNILLSGSRQPTELENRLVSNICYSVLFGSTKKEIKKWIKILLTCSKKTTSQQVHFCLYHIMLCTIGHFVLAAIFCQQISSHTTTSTSSSLHSAKVCKNNLITSYTHQFRCPVHEHGVISDVAFANVLLQDKSSYDPLWLPDLLQKTESIRRGELPECSTATNPPLPLPRP